jgi:putative ABC transport system permease protein
VLVGGLAGLLAASGAALLGWALANYQFKFPWSFEPGVWLAGLVAGIVCALVGGWLGLRSVLRQPPLADLARSVKRFVMRVGAIEAAGLNHPNTLS